MVWDLESVVRAAREVQYGSRQWLSGQADDWPFRTWIFFMCCSAGAAIPAAQHPQRGGCCAPGRGHRKATPLKRHMRAQTHRITMAKVNTMKTICRVSLSDGASMNTSGSRMGMANTEAAWGGIEVAAVRRMPPLCKRRVTSCTSRLNDCCGRG